MVDGVGEPSVGEFQLAVSCLDVERVLCIPRLGVVACDN